MDESKNTELIRWSDRGDSFIVIDEDEFARTLIPELFKHNNYASFVRQLNMYGFHKRVGLSDNSMRASERKNKSPSEYFNPYFKRGHPNLLWLINKPTKNVSGKKSVRKGAKVDETKEGDSDDEMDGVEETINVNNYPKNLQSSSAISTAPETQLPGRELALQQQLGQVQQKQNLLFSALHRMQLQHNQILAENRRFQELHERHDQSLNAILSFLATVYNRRLDGQTSQNLNIAQIFQSSVPQDGLRANGNVMEMEDDPNTSHSSSGRLSPSPMRHKAQRLLMAPPSQDQSTDMAAVGKTSSLTANMSHGKGNMEAGGDAMRLHEDPRSTSGAGFIEEVFDSPGDTSSPKIALNHEPPDKPAQADIMQLIESTNRTYASPAPSTGTEIPDVLSQYEGGKGMSQAQLTTEERNDMLSLMSQTLTNSDNGNIPPMIAPVTPPNFGTQLEYTSAELEDLLRMQHENDDQLGDISKQLDGSLSPSIDLDQFLDTGAYYDNNTLPDNLGDFANFDTMPGFGFGDYNDLNKFENPGDVQGTPDALSEPQKSNGQRSPKRRKA